MPTSSPSVRAQICQGVADRLETVKTSNGYTTNIRRILYDDVELGMDLKVQHMPAIIVLDEGVSWNHQLSSLDGQQSLRLQLVLAEGSKDEDIHEMIRDVAKALFANSPTSERVDGFRTIHPKIKWIQLTDDITDLHMIRANRIATLRLLVHYRTKPWDL